MYTVLKALLIPPVNLILIFAGGLALIVRGRRKSGLAVVAAGIILLYLMSVAVFSSFLGRLVQSDPPFAPGLEASLDTQAIVVLSAGYDHSAPEYGGRTIDAVTLQRLRYAAHLSRTSGLPILVSGGQTDDESPPLADFMRAALEQDFGLQVRWVENKSLDTQENARLSAAMLKADGVQKVILITHASHMPRARMVFEAQGLHVTPAPTGFAARARFSGSDFVPQLSRLEESYYAIYELFGQAWYAVRSDR